MFQLNSWILPRSYSSISAACKVVDGLPSDIFWRHSRSDHDTLGSQKNLTVLINTIRVLRKAPPKGRVMTGQSIQRNWWSHRIFRRYTTSLPTSLNCIASINQRMLSVETCCGASVRLVNTGQIFLALGTFMEHLAVQRLIASL